MRKEPRKVAEGRWRLEAQGSNRGARFPLIIKYQTVGLFDAYH